MDKKLPERKCIGCGEVKNKSDLVRIVRTAEGETKVDLTGRMNGRGAYLCRSAACLEKAMKNKGLNRSFKMPVDHSIYEELKKEFEAFD